MWLCLFKGHDWDACTRRRCGKIRDTGHIPEDYTYWSCDLATNIITWIAEIAKGPTLLLPTVPNAAIWWMNRGGYCKVIKKEAIEANQLKIVQRTKMDRDAEKALVAYGTQCPLAISRNRSENWMRNGGEPPTGQNPLNKGRSYK